MLKHTSCNENKHFFFNPLPWFHRDHVKADLFWHRKRQTTTTLLLTHVILLPERERNQADSEVLPHIHSFALKFTIMCERALSWLSVCVCWIFTIGASSCFYRPLQKGLLFSHLGNSWAQISLIFTDAINTPKSGGENLFMCRREKKSVHALDFLRS